MPAKIVTRATQARVPCSEGITATWSTGTRVNILRIPLPTPHELPVRQEQLLGKSRHVWETYVACEVVRLGDPRASLCLQLEVCPVVHRDLGRRERGGEDVLSYLGQLVGQTHNYSFVFIYIPVTAWWCGFDYACTASPMLGTGMQGRTSRAFEHATIALSKSFISM